MSWHRASIRPSDGFAPGSFTTHTYPCLSQLLHWRLQNRDFAIVPSTLSAGILLQKRALPFYFFKYRGFSLVMFWRVAVISEPLLLGEIQT